MERKTEVSHVVPSVTRVYATLLLALLLAGCNRSPISTASTDNHEVAVDKLFTHEGCTIFRFSDGGYDHYFADCRGATVSQDHGCGKGCARHEDVETL